MWKYISYPLHMRMKYLHCDLTIKCRFLSAFNVVDVQL